MTDPLDAARARGVRYSQEILNGSDMLSEPDVLQLLDVPAAHLASMREQRQVLALPDGNAFKYPAWQFDTGRHAVLPGLADILAILGSDWAVWFWLTKHDPFLHDRRPIDMLKHGRIAEVIEAARLYREYNAGT